MSCDPDIHHRRSVRLGRYDYSQNGAYFITVCCHGWKCLLGRIVSGRMVLSSFGRIVSAEWERTEVMRPHVRTDSFVVMPNHVHGIIMIEGKRGSRGTLPRAPQSEQFGKPTSDSIPTIVRSFKAATTVRINRNRNKPGEPFWQRNYYEHVIRDEDELYQIHEYIRTNPIRWAADTLNRTND
ncbi:MAG: transposase [Planctomycetes bacterium]|nr:transposase [Planctomycetota bacterium]NOG55701.1 transposase [Planctomycetota bacterium]